MTRSGALLCITLLPLLATAGETVPAPEAAAEALLDQPATGEWSLKAMVEAGQRREANRHESSSVARGSQPVVKEQTSALKVRLAAARKDAESAEARATDLQQRLNSTEKALADIRSELQALKTGPAAPAPMVPVHLPEDTVRIRDLSTAMIQQKSSLEAAENQVSTLKAALATRDAKLSTISTAVKALQASLLQKTNELKQASSTLADLREQQQPALPVSEADRQAWMAGSMMAGILRNRLDAWRAAGVTPDENMFRHGLLDGLTGHPRLTGKAAQMAREAFMKSIQQGVTLHVAKAQAQLNALAKGRSLLRESGGIRWYRVKAGSPVKEGGPVRLSMTERVAGGRTVSTVPPLTLTPQADMPSVVRDGMYLPGTGGEVLGYGLASSVYGPLPLPSGVQPWTVMEYHLRGEAVKP